jgi:streptogrisin C
VSRHRLKQRKVVVPAVGITAVLTGIAAAIAGPALARTDSSPPAPVSETAVALQRDLKMSAGQVQDRLRQESAATSGMRSILDATGQAYAGSWFDSATGKMTVAITDVTKTGEVETAGAAAKVVAHSMAELKGGKAKLDTLAGGAPASVTGWYVDPRSNSVVVDVDPRKDTAATDQFVTKAKATGMPVRVQRTARTPKPLADIVGGEPFTFSEGGQEARCSIGFPATGADGSKHFLTAGHCTADGGTAVDGAGAEIGPITKSTFNTKGDFGLVDVTNPADQLRPLVTKDGKSTIAVTGSKAAPVGSSICRSGSTSGFHCGEVTALDQTVNYGNGDAVQGLTQTTVCAEPGDSGGPYISGTEAQGMTSGGSGDCTVGGETFFQPVNEALQTLGMQLVTQ